MKKTILAVGLAVLLLGFASFAGQSAAAASPAATVPAPQVLLNDVLLPELRSVITSEARRWAADALQKIIDADSVQLADEKTSTPASPKL